MKKFSLLFILSLSFVLLPSISFIPMTEVLAQEGEQRKTKKVGAMTEKVAKKLSAAQELIEEEKIDEGLKELNDIMAFILRENGFPGGDESLELDPNSEGERIIIDGE